MYLGSSLIVAFIGIAINPLMAMNLSPHDYAIIGYFTSFNLLLIPLLHFNTMTYYLRNVYRIADDKKDITADTILIGLIFIGLGILLLFTGGFYFYCQYAQVEFEFFPYAIITFAQVYVSVFTTFYLTKLRINRDAKTFARVTITNCLVVTALSIILVVYYKFGASGKLYASLIGTFIVAIYSFRKALVRWQFDFSILKDALKFGLPLTLSSLLWYFLSGVDRAFLADLNDSYTYGIYSVAIQVVSYLTIFYTAVNNTFEPDIYKAIADNRIDRLMKLMLGILGIVAVANVVFIIFAPFAIGLLTANRYIESASYAQILALGNITMALYYLVVKLIIGYGYVKSELFVRIVGAISSVVMFKLLISNFGFYGAAWGHVLSFFVISILGLSALAFLRNRDSKKIGGI